MIETLAADGLTWPEAFVSAVAIVAVMAVMIVFVKGFFGGWGE